jgi:hypothetical protein
MKIGMFSRNNYQKKLSTRKVPKSSKNSAPELATAHQRQSVLANALIEITLEVA